MGLITGTLEEVEKLIAECKEKALNIIADSKQENPKINVICNSPRIFTMKSKDLSSESWSPRYYDYGWQFDNLIKTLRSKGLDSFKKTIQMVLDTGKLDGEKYHPDVLKVLQEIL